MCGIVGQFARDGSALSPDRTRRAVEVMAHRGPDETGFWSGGGVELGMCRLAIIAPDGNHQPAQNEDGSVRVVFNGQIYNHPELRRELESLGHRFRSDGDTEVIVHAWEEWGVDAFARMNGMFGLAIHDARDGDRLILSRDRLGIKPLYYQLSEDRVTFASEVKSLLVMIDETPGVNSDAMLSLLTFEYVYAPHTLFQGVHKLEPGTCLIVTDRTRKQERFWSMPTTARSLSESDADAEVRDLLSDAVRSRMISDVPLGAFLSGGIDSSIIVALMTQHSDRPVKTFSVGFEDATYNESRFARMIADRYKTEHHEILLRVDMNELMKPVELILDDPIGDFSVFSTWLVSRAAREHVTVVLSGDGGDELFGGYDTYLADKLSRTYALLGRTLTSRLIPSVLDRVRPSRAKKGLINRLKVFSRGAARPVELGHARWMIFMDDATRSAILTDDFAAEVSALDPTDHVRRLAGECHYSDALAKDMYVDARFYLTENILHKVDRTSMAVSLETRVPFLDHRVVESALTMPTRHRVNGFRRKAILKRAFADLLPETIIRRGKEGFSTPMKHWLRSDLKERMLDTLSESRLRQDGYFRPSTVRKLIDEHLEERADHAHLLWSMTLFGMWRERYQNSSAALRRSSAAPEVVTS
jgi:asparagine synthase (glutamine-hydrolysing)